MKLEYFLNEVLPSGSGFNCDWDFIKQQKNNTLVFETYYHNMDEDGYYDGYTKIRLKIPTKIMDFTVTLSQGRSMYMDYSTRDYHVDTIMHCLEGRAFMITDI